MASQTTGIDSQPRLSRPRQWPGERQPTRWDVHDANESPAVTFLDRFRSALLHSEGAEEGTLLNSESVIDTSETMNSDSVRLYTYPMVMLSDVPTTPSDDVLARLHAEFFKSFEQHIFIKTLDIANWSSVELAPYLQLALACMGSVAATSTGSTSYLMAPETPQAEVSTGLFVAGVNLWSVMLEVDNREARLFEAVIAAALLSTYGTLSADCAHRRKASGILCNVVTITRRLHLTDGYLPVYASAELPEKVFKVKSSLISYLILIDTMHGLHFGLTPNYSIGELFIKMPSSNHQFRTVYNSLTQGYHLPPDVQSREDALLLLTALLSDIIYMQRCHLSVPFLPSYEDNEADGLSKNQDRPSRNPFTPLSMKTEFSRISADILAALSRWEQHFKHQVVRDILPLCYFTKLQLICPDLGNLSHMAGYAAAPGFKSNQLTTPKTFDVSDKAMDLAWLILDHCDKISESPEGKLAIWLPNVLFSSALLVWWKLQSQAVTDRKYGTLKVLTMFKSEIAKLPWPCCRDMTKTLDRLMER